MTSSIRNIGNSKGVILPKGFLAQCAIENEVSIEVKDGAIVITPVKEKGKRKGWEKTFKQMTERWDDALAMPDVFADENTDDWDVYVSLGRIGYPRRELKLLRIFMCHNFSTR